MKKLTGFFVFVVFVLPVFAQTDMNAAEDKTTTFINWCAEQMKSLEKGEITLDDKDFLGEAAAQYNAAMDAWKECSSKGGTNFTEYSKYQKARLHNYYYDLLQMLYDDGLDEAFSDLTTIEKKTIDYIAELENMSLTGNITIVWDGKNFNFSDFGASKNSQIQYYYEMRYSNFYMIREDEKAAFFANKFYATSNWQKEGSDDILIAGDALYREEGVSAKYHDLLSVGSLKLAADFSKDPVDADSVVLQNIDFIVYRLDYHYTRKSSDLIPVSGMSTYAENYARALFRMKKKTRAADYAEISFATGNTSKAFVDFCTDSIQLENATQALGKEMTQAVLKYSYSYSISDIRELADFMGDLRLPDEKAQLENLILEKEEAQRKLERRQKQLETRRKFNLSVGIEPLGFIYGQANLALELRIGKVSNEFRYAHIYKGKNSWRFGSAFEDDGTPYRFTGFEAGYCLKFFIYGVRNKSFRPEFKTGSGRATYSGVYLGPDFRFSLYRYDSLSTTATDIPSGAVLSTEYFSPVSKRYEGGLRIGTQAILKWAYFDLWSGIGLGYRDLTVSQGYDTKNTTFSDPRFDSDRFNKFYCVIRFGLRIGIAVL